jgi:hypothetical protein
MPIDPAALTAGIARLELAQTPDAEPGELLHRVLDTAQELFGLSGVGLMFVDESEALRFVAATDSAVRALERAQEETGEGPCVDALVLGRVVASTDLETDERYTAVGPSRPSTASARCWACRCSWAAPPSARSTSTATPARVGRDRHPRDARLRRRREGCWAPSWRCSGTAASPSS